MFKNYYVKVFFIFIISRFIIVFFAYLWRNIYVGSKELKTTFCQWDCGWYLSIIERGYDMSPHKHVTGDAANWAFFPVFPKVVSIISNFFQISPLTIALVLNNIFFLIGLYVLFLYVKREFDEKIAIITITLMSFSPYSLYFSVPYTESTFFLLLVLVFYFSTESKWIYAGIFAALLSGTRSIGVMIVFSIFIMAIKQYGFKSLILFRTDISYKILFTILITPLGLFLYMHYLYTITGDALAFKHIQIAWGREVSNPLFILFEGLKNPFNSYEYYTAIATLLGLCLTFFLLYKKRYAEFIFMLIAILIPLSTSLSTMPRYIFALFPMYLAFSLIVSKYDGSVVKLLCFLFSGGLVFMTISWVMAKDYMI